MGKANSTTRPAATPAPMSLRTYAQRRGVSAEAVSKAITAGRLRDSVVAGAGGPKIGDPELADREWAANTRPRVDHPAAAEEAPAEGSPAGVPSYNESRARREAAAARREAALADLAELDVAQRRGELVLVAEVRADVIEKFALVKTKILGVPSGLAQRMPHLAAEVVPVLDELLRDALEELAVLDDDQGGEPDRRPNDEDGSDDDGEA